MSSLRTAKIEALYAELAAQFINRESAGQALITVTGTREFNRGHNMTVFVTVLPTSREQAVLDFLTRKKREFGEYVMERSRMRSLPKVQFAIDLGEKNRQRLEEVSQEEAKQEVKRQEKWRSGEAG